MSDFPTAPGDATAMYRALLDAICRIENRLDKIEKNKEVVNNIIDRLALAVERAAARATTRAAQNVRLEAMLTEARHPLPEPPKEEP